MTDKNLDHALTSLQNHFNISAPDNLTTRSQKAAFIIESLANLFGTHVDKIRTGFEGLSDDGIANSIARVLANPHGTKFNPTNG